MVNDHRALAAQLRELMGKATPGPWAFGGYGDENKYGIGVVMDANDAPVVGYDESGDGVVVESVAPEVDGYANAALIAATHNALPALLDRLELLVDVAKAAKGLAHGVDWNKGTHAKIYRPKLNNALNALEDSK